MVNKHHYYTTTVLSLTAGDWRRSFALCFVCVHWFGWFLIIGIGSLVDLLSYFLVFILLVLLVFDHLLFGFPADFLIGLPRACAYACSLIICNSFQTPCYQGFVIYFHIYFD